jgi:hypothetical protein
VLNTAGETGLRDAKPLLALGLAGSLVATSILNVNAYLYAYPPVVAVQPVTLITDVARFLAHTPAGEPVILYDDREFYLAHWTIRLLAPRVTGVTEWTSSGVLAAARATGGRFLFLDVDRDTDTLTQLRELYPGGTLTLVPVHDPAHRVLAYAHSRAADRLPGPPMRTNQQAPWRPRERPQSLGTGVVGAKKDIFRVGAVPM